LSENIGPDVKEQVQDVKNLVPDGKVLVHGCENGNGLFRNILIKRITDCFDTTLASHKLYTFAGIPL
jgi:hypothetical protein